MKRNVLLVDVALAVGLAALVLIIAPGLAIVGIIALLALIVCGVTFGVGARRRRRGGRVQRQRTRLAMAARPPGRAPARAPARTSSRTPDRRQTRRR